MEKATFVALLFGAFLWGICEGADTRNSTITEHCNVAGRFVVDGRLYWCEPIR